MTAACTFDIRTVQIIGADGAAGAAGQGGTGNARDASHETSDARAGSDGAGGQGGRADASVDGNAGAGGFSGAAGKGGAAGASGSSGAAGKAGSAGVGGSGGAAGSSGAGGRGGSGGAAGSAGVGGGGGAAGIAGLGGAAGLAGIGGAAGLSGGGGAAGRDGGTTGGTAGQAGGATGGSDGGTSVDASDAGSGGTADGGVVVFFQENFDSTLGAFMQENQCGSSPPVWSNNAGYAHAPDPAVLGISSIYSPAIPVPANVSDIRLRLSHKLGMIRFGYHGAQLLVSVNSKTPEVVKNFTVGPYVNGSCVNPDTCTARPEPTWIDDAWSGNLPEFESEATLSGAPFNVVGGDTVSIRFRMLTDNYEAGNGWDINWVKLAGNAK